MIKNIKELINSQPTYRLKQIHQAWFDVNINSYDQITTLPKDLREKLKDVPWLVVKEKVILKSKLDDTCKALLELVDGNTIETILMGREGRKTILPTPPYPPPRGELIRKRYTICLSTQVGCPMKCSFCATGQMGFKRNLTIEEITDQYRFWQRYLAKGKQDEIANVVLMGQGEPFLNYDNVREALNIILNNTEIGPRKITISTVGVKAGLEKMLADKNFPPVRFALSLHSASEKTRVKIIPSHQAGFLKFLIDWAKKYHETFPSRTHFIGLEYTLLKGINDKPADLKDLKKLASKLGRIRINLIPFNYSTSCHSEPRQSRGEESLSQKTLRQRSLAATRDDNNANFISSPLSTAEHWRDTLIKSGFVATIRHSQGQDISAACGQLQNISLS